MSIDLILIPCIEMRIENKIVLIAGGTGFIGTAISSVLQKKGCEVRILSRKKTDVSKNLYHWNPLEKTIDEKAFADVQVIVNLVGEGIVDKKWTAVRKQLLVDSRVQPTLFLRSLANKMPSLQQYVSASGINAYGFEDEEMCYTESNTFGNDFVSQMVKDWENAADKFSDFCQVAKIRIAVVLSKNEGALPKMAAPIKYFAGAAMGSGKQNISWISIDDLSNLFLHVIEQNLDGVYNAVANNCSNKQFTQELAKAIDRPLLPLNLPGFVLKLILGDRAVLLLNGVKASNFKIVNSGFTFTHPQLADALKVIYSK